MGMELKMLHMATGETFSITLALKEGPFKTNYSVDAQHNYYGAVIPLLNLAAAVHCSQYVQMHNCCQDV